MRPARALHRPFEDAGTSSTIQRALMRHHQFQGLDNVAHGPVCVDRLREAQVGPLQDPLPAPRVHHLVNERVYLPTRSMTSAEEDLNADDDDDDAVDSATCNSSSSNANPGNGENYVLLINLYTSLVLISICSLYSARHNALTEQFVDNQLAVIQVADWSTRGL